MKFSIIPYDAETGAETLMEPWPLLVDKAFCLKNNSRPGETVFFFDSAPLDRAAGNTVPVVVLIHGLGDEADTWRHLIPLLNSWGCRALALDLPGFGRSAAPGKISFKNHVVAVLRLIKAVVQGPEQGVVPPVFLVGNSMGAVIAEEVALKMPDIVRGIILLDGSIPGGPANPGLLVLARLLFTRGWYRSYRDDPERAWGSLYPYYANIESMPPLDREFLRRRVMARVISPAQERAFFASQQSLVWVTITALSRFSRKIPKFKGKITLIWGDKDKIVPVSSTVPFRALRNDIELHLIPGAGHLPHQEKPEECARLIADFVNNCLSTKKNVKPS